MDRWSIVSSGLNRIQTNDLAIQVQCPSTKLPSHMDRWSIVSLLGLLFQLLKLKAHCEDHKFHSCLSALHIYDFHIFIFRYVLYHRVYDELTIDHLSTWLGSSVDRADCTAIERSWVQIPIKPKFFSGCFFNCLS